MAEKWHIIPSHCRAEPPKGGGKKHERDVGFCRIFPGIGIGRVGNSPTNYFIGPEAPGYTRSQEDPLNPPNEEFRYKDASGRMKRQAVRFRVYAYPESERDKEYYATPSRELTLDDEDIKSIEWTVTLANTKSSADTFETIYVVVESDVSVRNPNVQDRDSLNITPSPIPISGRDTNNLPGGSDENYVFNDGSFMEQRVTLGELKTDTQGRLLVLGGFGHAYSTPDAGPLLHYANNDEWADDIADGPVTCRITFSDGTVLEGLDVLQSHVVIAPPKYSPEMNPLKTLFTLMEEVAIDKGYLAGGPQDCVYYRDIHPIILSGINYSWTSRSAFLGHRDGLATLQNPTYLEKDKSSRQTPDPSWFSEVQIARMNADKSRRQAIFDKMRAPMQLLTREGGEEQAQFSYMPILAGETSSNFGRPVVGDAKTWWTVTQKQYKKLKLWVDGDFEMGSPPEYPATFSQDDGKEGIPLADQPAALDRATLEPCTGGPFAPGIEWGSDCASADSYMAAFRLNKRKYAPGDATKDMAVPWSADFYECRAYWWPSQRPDEVISHNDYSVHGEDSVAYSLPRVGWDRGIVEYPYDDHAQNWYRLGFVVPLPGRNNFAIQVETERDPTLPEKNPLGSKQKRKLRKNVPKST